MNVLRTIWLEWTSYVRSDIRIPSKEADVELTRALMSFNKRINYDVDTLKRVYLCRYNESTLPILYGLTLLQGKHERWRGGSRER